MRSAPAEHARPVEPVTPLVILAGVLVAMALLASAPGHAGPASTPVAVLSPCCMVCECVARSSQPAPRPAARPLARRLAPAAARPAGTAAWRHLDLPPPAAA
ncbi:MAG: hypothetical protein U0574_07625 [Phycisphaerales bacterium]